MRDGITAFFDCDDTLILHNYHQLDIEKTIEIGLDGFKIRVLPHLKHIESIKLHKAQNHVVVVWSLAGVQWAEAVVKALVLESYVDLVISKPNCFYDDLKPEDFMQNRYYYKLEEK